MKNLLKKTKAYLNNLKENRALSSIPLHNRKSFNPVFLIGCGRSGTTILGKTLSSHPDIKYLNERRDIWQYAYPEFDIWSKSAFLTRKAKLFAGGKDVDERKNKTLHHNLHREQILANKTTLLEKLPINNFRLDFLHSIFPTAKYIYLHRNGLEVATSIAKMIPGGWFGYNDLKLDLLKKFACTHPLYNTFIEKLNSDFHNAIFEWRLSIDQSDQFFREKDPESFFALSYEDFMTDPELTIKKILVFLNLPSNDSLISQMTSPIGRKNEKLNDLQAFDEITSYIGGDILRESIQNSYFR